MNDGKRRVGMPNRGGTNIQKEIFTNISFFYNPTIRRNICIYK